MCAYYSVIIPYHTLKIRQMETSLLQIKFYYLKVCIYICMFPNVNLLFFNSFFSLSKSSFFIQNTMRVISMKSTSFLYLECMSTRNQNVCLLNMYCIFDLKNPLIIKQNLKLHTCTMVRPFSNA